MGARAVAIDEGRNDEVALRDPLHVGTGLFHHADEFVANRTEIVGGLAAVVPEVRTANACKDHADDCVRRRADHRVGALSNLDRLRSVEDGRPHHYPSPVDGAAAYSASLTGSPQVAFVPFSSTSSIARWVMNRAGDAPCQWCSPGSKNTRSPGRITSTEPPRRWANPTPSMTKIVCPFGCVCHTVRAPGVKWTLLALRRAAPAGAATGSM